MLARMWPFLLRVAIGVYFIAPHITPFLDSVMASSSLVVEPGLYSCLDAYMPVEIAFSMYHGFFVILGLLIIGLMRSVFPAVVALAVIGLSLYIDFAKEGYSASTLLLFILMLVTTSVIMYSMNPRFNQ